MSVELKMPKAGLTNTEGTITQWIAQEGAQVRKGETILCVENEKSTFDFESPADGVLLRLAGEGAQVKVGAAMGLLADSQEEYERLRRAPAKEEVVASSTPAQKESSRAPAAQTSARRASDGERIRISPYARKLAQNQGIDPARVHGTGPSGRIVARDVEHFSGGKEAMYSDSRPSRDTASLLLDLSGAQRLTRALNQSGAGLTISDILCVSALRAATSVYGEACSNLVLKYVDAGALMTSFLHGAGGMTPRKLCQALHDAKNGAPSGEIVQGLELFDLTGQSADSFLPGGGNTPVTLAFGRIAQRAMVLDGQIEIRSSVTLSAAGNDAAALLRLLSAIKRFLEFPESILY